MKGVILAGGLGTRLGSLTKITNKHLLPVYDRPMIYYPIQTLINIGVQDILLVTGGRGAGDFLRLLGNGRAFGLKHIHYTYQENEGGIAAALSLAEDFAGGEKICVILGDNLIEKNVKGAADAFREQKSGAKIILKETTEARRFGVAEIREGRVVGIEEKPERPRSKYAVTGIYFYDGKVFDIVRTLKPSARNELEITDVNNAYIARSEMTYDLLDGWWSDAGTIESIYRAATLVLKTGANRLE